MSVYSLYWLIKVGIIQQVNKTPLLQAAYGLAPVLISNLLALAYMYIFSGSILW